MTDVSLRELGGRQRTEDVITEETLKVNGGQLNIRILYRSK